MTSTARILTFLIILAILFSVGQASQYLYLSDEESTFFSERIKFQSGDTLDGPIHSNSLIAIMGSPVFLDRVSTTESDFWRGLGYAPLFLGPPVIFNALEVRIPTRLERMREDAGPNWFDGQNGWVSHFIRFRGREALVYAWTTGTPFDSSHYTSVTLTDNPGTVIFVDGPLRLEGIVEGRAFVGCSGTIEINGDITYADADLDGRVPTTSANYLVIAAEGDIKIRNTPQNGRWNSNGRGYDQTNPDSTGVLISAQLYALGNSFTFEQQNDADSGYVSDLSPDHRGTVRVFGSLVQRRRGYMHRATFGGTGYRKRYNYDQRFRNFDDYVNEWLHVEPDTLNFGNVAVGQSVEDSVVIDVMPCSYLGTVSAAAPFAARRLQPYYANGFTIPVTFTPARVGPVSGNLGLVLGTRYLQIPLRGRGVAPGGPLLLSAAPNPFNSATTIRYTLPGAGRVRIVLYDVLGRAAKTFDLPAEAAGEHRLHLSAAELASGVYFLRLDACHEQVTQKLLLIK